jgi:hypothetical protein
LAVLLILILSFSFNVFVHDFGLAPTVEVVLGGWSWRLQMAASGLNLLVLAAWTASLVGRRSRVNGAEAPSVSTLTVSG